MGGPVPPGSPRRGGSLRGYFCSWGTVLVLLFATLPTLRSHAKLWYRGLGHATGCTHRPLPCCPGLPYERSVSGVPGSASRPPLSPGCLKPSGGQSTNRSCGQGKLDMGKRGWSPKASSLPLSREVSRNLKARSPLDEQGVTAHPLRQRPPRPALKVQPTGPVPVLRDQLCPQVPGSQGCLVPGGVSVMQRSGGVGARGGAARGSLRPQPRRTRAWRGARGARRGCSRRASGAWAAA